MIGENKVEFVRLFQEFVSSYPYTPAGLRHIAAYEEQRQQGQRNFEAITTAADFGKDVTEAVLLQLLPYTNSGNNLQKGAWIHNAPCISGELKGWLEKLGWTKSEDWSFIAQAILRFVRYCNDEPSQLLAACAEFLELPYSKGFPMETLTPILHALRPDEFLLINRKSQRVINYFANTSYEEKLTDYPAANFTGHKLIEKLAKEMHQAGVPALRDDDLFDMFCHWLVAVKQYDFAGKEPPTVDEVVEITSNIEQVELQAEYILTQLADDIGFEEAELKRWIRAIERKKQVILYGSPGTGKTYIAEHIASIALVDHALRRRFAFIELRPNYDVLRRYHQKKKTDFQVDGLIETLKRLNHAIADKHYEVGISYFLTENLAEELEDIWQMEIEPYLEEYFYDQLGKVDEFRWDKIKKQVCP
jgi:5-methylcytosine-specific restriction protein B